MGKQRSGGEENVLTLSSMEGLLANVKYVCLDLSRVTSDELHFYRVSFKRGSRKKIVSI